MGAGLDPRRVTTASGEVLTLPNWGRRVGDPGLLERRAAMRLVVIRVLIVLTVVLGTYYIAWRYEASVNWRYWPLALALLAAETYSYVSTWFFGLSMWRLKPRGEPPVPLGTETVDILITCYNESVELMRETVRASLRITHPHQTYVLDDGNSPAMREMAAAEGAGYIVRTVEWIGRDRHAKAGNLNNALFQTNGEFLLILDADQVPLPTILDRTVGYFRDPKVAFVQTPQWFQNVPEGDPFGSQAPLFYGPIQEGKDGWNAAFFCGSNAVLRREALMHAGVVHYAHDLERRVTRALGAADEMLRGAGREAARVGQSRFLVEIEDLRGAVRRARTDLRRGEPLQEVTWRFQRRAEEASRRLVDEDLATIRDDLYDIPGIESDALGPFAALLDDEEALRDLAGRQTSPLTAITAVRDLLLAVDVDRDHEAMPIVPMSTISVTEDMATAMRLHALGWRSVFHPEILAHGLAPEDLGTALQQRLRWAQGTIQVMLRENPLAVRGLSWSQKLMYFSTMWSYLSGFFALVYLAAPVLYLLFGWTPVDAWSAEFFWRLVPYLVINQLFFIVVAWGLPTWRGQQYSLALFPVWIQSVTSAIGSVYFRRKLGFIVTSKVRQEGVSLGMIRPQLVAMGLLAFSVVVGLARLAFGATEDGIPLLINVLWALYDIAALSIVVDAATYQPRDAAKPEMTLGRDSFAAARGRVAAGRA